MLESILGAPPLVPHHDQVQRGYELPCAMLEVDGATVRCFSFSVTPDASAPIVVCLPGLGASGRSFAPLAPLAPTHRLLLWTPPLRTPPHVAPLAHNLEVLGSAQAPLPPRFTLLGSSYGSLIALRFALAHPERVRSLILVSPVASLRRVRRWAVVAATLLGAPRPFAYVLAPLVARVLGGPELPAEGRAEIVREARRLSPMELARRLRDVLSADLLPRLAELRLPVLVLHGRKDRVVPLSWARDVAERLPHGRLEVIERAAHLPYMSHPEQFNAHVSRFIEEVGE